MEKTLMDLELQYGKTETGRQCLYYTPSPCMLGPSSPSCKSRRRVVLTQHLLFGPQGASPLPCLLELSSQKIHATEYTRSSGMWNTTALLARFRS